MFGRNDFAAPEIPALAGGDSLRLEDLKGEDLEVVFTYPGIEYRNRYYIIFRCQTAEGETDVLRIGGVPPENAEDVTGYVSYARVSRWSGGWGFASIATVDAANRNYQESYLRFFYVDKAAPAVRELSPAQILEVDGPHIDLDRMFGDVTVVTGTYHAMAVGDRITLTWQGQDEHGSLLGPVSLQQQVENEADIGKPLRWALDGNELALASDGLGELSYTIEYGDSTTTSHSPKQRFPIVRGAPEAPRLSKPRIEGLVGDQLDPDDYPEGIVVQVDDYGMQLDDEIVLHVRGREHATRALSVDVSILHSGKIRFGLEHAWLKANAGMQVTMAYQWGRWGDTGVSDALTLVIGDAPVLPAPIVQGALPEGDDKGSLIPAGAINMRVPEYVTRTALRMYAVNQMGERLETTPNLGDPKAFQFLAREIAGSLGQRLQVFYSFRQDDSTIAYSKAYDLGILNVVNPNHFKPIKCEAAPDGRLSLSAVPDAGVMLELPLWWFATIGQQARIHVVGNGVDGNPLPVEVLRDDQPLTTDERKAGKVEVRMGKAFLQRLKLNDIFRVRVAVSFDAGRSFKTFPLLVLTLVS